MATETIEITLTSDTWTDLSPNDEPTVSLQNQDRVNTIVAIESTSTPSNNDTSGRIVYPYNSLLSYDRGGSRFYGRCSSPQGGQGVYSAKVSVTR